MLKKKQLNSSKRTSLEKQNPNNHISQKKAVKPAKIESSKSKPKQAKNQKGARPNSQQRSKSKGNLQENLRQPRKSTYEVDQILMKKDLKHLLTKKGIRKSKQTNIVPEILKKIEENCRILKKIDFLSHHASHKKVGKQSVSNSKSFKYSQINNKSQLPINKNRTKSRQLAIDSERQGKKSSRRSHQLSNQHKTQDKVEIKISSKVKNMPKTSNMIEVVQEYKKIIDVGQIKVERSSKNTNYNSSQSRNSSSLHNSHALFNILQSKSKNHKFQNSSTNMDKIQGLIRQQQSNIELNKSQRPLILTQNPQEEPKPSDFQVHKQIQFINILSQKKNDQGIQEKYNESINKESNQSRIKADSEIINNAFWEKQNERSARNFEKSKYYVQPIPPFRGKKSQEDSLIGCEIPLIENNIINDSQLPELQL